MKDPLWYLAFDVNKNEKTVDFRDLGSSVPRSKSQTESQQRRCETEVGSPKF